MSGNEIRETLEKQLQLLSERSAGLNKLDSTGLLELTKAMCLLADAITRFPPHLP